MSETEKTAESEKNAEVIHLKSDIAGVGRAGDTIVHNPDHPNPALRLCRVIPLDADLLSAVKEHAASAEPQEPTKPDREQLMPWEAYEAMTDALRPIVNGLWAMTDPSEIIDLYVDRSDRSEWQLTEQGCIHLEDIVEGALNAVNRFDKLQRYSVQYFPQWCQDQFNEINTIVDRAAWILWGASVSAGDWETPYSSAPEAATLACGGAYWMVKEAYEGVCGKSDEYEAAERVAIDKQYEDEGWIKQPNGEWHAPQSVLDEMEAGV